MNNFMQERQAALNQIAKIAVRLQAETGCPALLMVTAWALESEWGQQPVGHANYFGMKRATRHKLWVTIPTHEFVDGKRVMQDLEFADYDSLDASCQDYAWLITHGAPYSIAWQRYQDDRDLPTLISSVAHIYATSPAYTNLALQISRQGNVLQAIAAFSS